MDEEIFNKVYDSGMERMKSKVNMFRVEKNRYKILIQFHNLYKELEKFIELDNQWATKEKICDYLKTIVPTTDFKMVIKKEDVIEMFIKNWNLEKEVIINSGWDNIELTCYKTGKFVKGYFDYRYEIEIEEDGQEDSLYKMLFLMLPNTSEKLTKYEKSFGNSSSKYKSVVISIIEQHFIDILSMLKEDCEQMFDEVSDYFLVQLTKHKMIQTS